MDFDLDKLVSRAAENNGLDPKMLIALIQKESSGNPNAISPAGARGLTQLMPGTAKDLGVKNPMDPEQNIMGGAKYLKQQLDAFGEPELALAAYNSGPGNVRKYGGIPPFPETQSYVSDIMKAITPINQEGPASLLNSNSGNNNKNLQSLLSGSLQNDKLSQRGAMIDSIFSGLAGIAGSFNRNRGAELQNLYATQFQNRQQQRAEQKKSQIEQIMKMAEMANKQPDLTNNLKEYQTAVNQGYKGTFFDYQKELKQAGAGVVNDPRMQEAQNLILNRVLDKLKGNTSISPSLPTSVNYKDMSDDEIKKALGV